MKRPALSRAFFLARTAAPAFELTRARPAAKAYNFRMKRLHAAFWLLIAAVAPIVAASTAGEVPIGGYLRDANLTGLNGPSRPLAAFRGEPLIINVWASWCGPCREEMASLERLAWLKQRVHFRIIGISTDDHPAKARRYLLAANATISQFIDTRLTMEHMLGASSIPLTVLVSARGRVLYRAYGARSWDGPSALHIIDREFAVRPAARRRLGR